MVAGRLLPDADLKDIANAEQAPQAPVRSQVINGWLGRELSFRRLQSPNIFLKSGGDRQPEVRTAPVRKDQYLERLALLGGDKRWKSRRGRGTGRNLFALLGDRRSNSHQRDSRVWRSERGWLDPCDN